MAKPRRASGSREHFGAGRLRILPHRSVFVNCPYDSEFEQLFDAVVFATVSCGFLPRSALESGTVAESRMERITQAIFSSKYSIHDLSRCQGQGDELLARFNMPLELGIAMARRHPRRGRAAHDWLLLVPNGHSYLKFISDLAGFDPKKHNGTVESVVSKVVAWLATRPDAIRTPTTEHVLSALPRFQQEKVLLKRQWRDEVPWADVVLAARKHVSILAGG